MNPVRLADHEAGFTLLEVLVAFVIAAVALGALFQGSIDGLRSVRVSGQYQEALSRARSRLAAADVGWTLVLGTQTGDDGGGFRWEMRVVPSATAPIARGTAADLARGPRVALYAVSVTIAWTAGGSRQVRLDGLRTVVLPPAPP